MRVMSGNSMLGFKDLPQDHPRRRAYRVGVAVVGVLLIVFGVVGYASGLGFLSTDGDRVLGVGSNGLLSTLSVLVGLVLIAGAAVDGNVGAYVNTIAGVVFMVAGVAGLTVLRTSYNYLDFDMWNVIVSFTIGLILFAAGLYGRVSE